MKDSEDHEFRGMRRGNADLENQSAIRNAFLRRDRRRDARGRARLLPRKEVSREGAVEVAALCSNTQAEMSEASRSQAFDWPASETTWPVGEPGRVDLAPDPFSSAFFASLN
jgi:hypothetical protein